MKKPRRKVSRKSETASKKTRIAKSTESTKRAPEKTQTVARATPPRIVGIGASAGGLEAFTELLGAIPIDTGMAFVLVQHLEPKHESVLTALLGRATKMPVHEAREGMHMEPNHVYVIPANADLSILDSLLHIEGRRASAGRHLPIDYFFRSLAESQGPQAIGVILSGTASDGTAGIRVIKEAGGITFAQDPESAKFDGMPRNAMHRVTWTWCYHRCGLPRNWCASLVIRSSACFS
jgi:two-component system, chemotaxis family, CheB/CheR fusion protein